MSGDIPRTSGGADTRTGARLTLVTTHQRHHRADFADSALLTISMSDPNDLRYAEVMLDPDAAAHLRTALDRYLEDRA